MSEELEAEKHQPGKRRRRFGLPSGNSEDPRGLSLNRDTILQRLTSPLLAREIAQNYASLGPVGAVRRRDPYLAAVSVMPPTGCTISLGGSSSAAGSRYVGTYVSGVCGK